MKPQLWDPQLYDQKHAFVSDYGFDVVKLLNPQKGERILDVGCGTGRLTDEIYRQGASVIGIDKSGEMVEQAQSTYPHIEFFVADANSFVCRQKFDAVFSNAALHWMHEPERVIKSVKNSLKPHGRFVAEFGGAGNVENILLALAEALTENGESHTSADFRGYFPTAEEYKKLLLEAGFTVPFISLFPRLTPLAEGENALRHWLNMFRKGSFDQQQPAAQEKILSAIEAKLRPELYKDNRWHADYVRLRFMAIAP